MNFVLENRTKHFTMVVEDIYQPHNASAVIRSCDCFGIQELHVIENKNKYKLNKDVSLGSSKWVDVIKYNEAENNTLDCIAKLREQGYKIVATTPNNEDIALEEFPVGQKAALFLGNEVDGLSKDAIANADLFLKIPMVGFTESLNISVTAAICMHYLTLNLHQSDICWNLTKEEKIDLKFKWVRSILQRSDLLEQEFWRKKENEKIRE